MSSFASDNGKGCPVFRTARNGTRTAYRAIPSFSAPFDIKAGSPVSALPGNTDGCSVIPPFAGGGIRGVLQGDLIYGPNGGQSSNMIKEGVCSANILIVSAAAAVVGASLTPVFTADPDGYCYFKVTDLSLIHI